MKGQNPHFFCEHCGAEVPFRSRTCPKCGRAFSSVRCPACNFAGEESLFTGGCPVCGYTADSRATNRRSADNRSGKAGKRRETGGVPAGALPLWVYVVSAFALFGIGYLVLAWLF